MERKLLNLYLTFCLETMFCFPISSYSSLCINFILIGHKSKSTWSNSLSLSWFQSISVKNVSYLNVTTIYHNLVSGLINIFIFCLLNCMFVTTINFLTALFVVLFIIVNLFQRNIRHLFTVNTYFLNLFWEIRWKNIIDRLTSFW